MKYLGNIFIWLVFGVVVACQKTPDAQSIIDAAIETHGGSQYENVQVSFDFRDRHYVLRHQNGLFQYERHFEDSTGKIRDILNNEGFKRFLNERDITDTVKKTAAYTRSVNSVAYFALLPYRLNDPAVVKKFLGEVMIKEEPYYKIEVTFQQEGGGEDFQDQFVYWIHKERNTMDYLAYLYFTDGGGKRFRAPYNQREINGLKFTDYENYRQVAADFPLTAYDSLYEAGALKLLSKIELEQIIVEPL